jgi:hypothetical protein
MSTFSWFLASLPLAFSNIRKAVYHGQIGSRSKDNLSQAISLPPE